jgi:hypothetical protein
MTDTGNRYLKILSGQTSSLAYGGDEGSSDQLSQDTSPPVPSTKNRYQQILGDDFQGFEAPKVTGTTATGAFLSGAIGSALPTGGALAGGAAGSTAGAEAGAAAGLATGPFAEVASPVLAFGGAVAGGIYGMIYGQKAVSTAQDWAVSKLPKSWQQALGQTQEQKEAYEKEHPLAYYGGGLVPVAVTMNPFAAAEKISAEGLTNFQKLRQNPLVSRLMSGTVMGGFEGWNEYKQGESPDWTKLAISTGFGFIMNRSNVIGETIGGVGSEAVTKTTRKFFGTDQPPTLAEANDHNVLGPGVTEEVFAGQEERNPVAQEQARKQAQVEQYVLGQRQLTDINQIARRIDPDTFEKYDDLVKQRDILEEWSGEHEGGEESEWINKNLAKVNSDIDNLRGDRGAAFQRALDHLGPEGESVIPQEITEAERSPEIMAKLSPPDRPIDAQRQTIQSEISQKLIDVGRPQDEAQEISKLASAYYETRAARFEGRLGTAEDLYRQSFPDIQKHIESASGASKKDLSNGYIENLFTDNPTVRLTKNANPSTFMHEMSHQWLVDFFKDAQHPEAPQSLKDDFQTVLDYLGVKNKENVTEAQHLGSAKNERWANSFEQYVREGVAPSKELAGTFGKLKNWMLSVYQTLKGLGKPISPEIRGVFDRMLAGEPGRVSIAPEEIREPQMHEIHEDIANNVAPHPEAPHMDMILSDTELFKKELPQEVKDEIEAEYAKRHPEARNSKPEGEATAGTNESERLERGSEQPRSLTESSISSEVNGEVAKSGGESRPSISPGVSGSEQSRLGEHQLAPNKSERFERPTRNIDKAGNIVVTNLETTDAIENVLKDFSAVNGGYMEMRQRMELTEGDANRLAGDLNLDVQKLGAIHKMSQIVSENILAARNLVKQSASEWIRLRDKALASGSDDDLIAWVDATKRHDLIQGYLSGITANSGRALNYFKKRHMIGPSPEEIDQFMKGSVGKTLFQLREDLEMSKNVDSVQKVSKFVEDSAKLQWSKMPLEYMINNLISNPITHMKYLLGNEIQTFLEMVPEKMVAAGIGKIRESLGQDRERVYAGEALQYVTGRNLPGSILAAGESFAKGTAVELPSETAKRLELEKKQKEIEESLQQANSIESVSEKKQKIDDLNKQKQKIEESMKQNELIQELRRRTNRLNDAQRLAESTRNKIQQGNMDELVKEKEDVSEYLSYKKEDLEKALTPDGQIKEVEKRTKNLEDSTKKLNDLQNKADTGDQRKDLRKRQNIKNLSKRIEYLKHSLTEKGIDEENSKIQSRLDSINKSKPISEETANKEGVESDINEQIRKINDLTKQTKELQDSINIGESSDLIQRRKFRIEQLSRQIEKLENSMKIENMTLARPFGSELAERPVLNQEAKWSDIPAATWGALKGIQDSFLTTAKLIGEGGDKNAPLIGAKVSNLGYIPDIQIKGVTALPLGTATRFASRMVSSIHSFSVANRYSGELNAWAYREATRQGRTGDAAIQKMAELRQNPPAEKMEEFHKTAYGGALMGETGPITEAISKVTNLDIGGFKPLKFIAPFNHIFSNIVRKTLLERTPAGFLSESIRNDLLGKNGHIAQDTAQARMLMGTAAAFLGGALYYRGVLSGSGPTDPNQNRAWREAGNQAYSMRIGDHWYDIGKLGPIGKLLGTAADLASVAHDAYTDGVGAAALHLAHAGSKLFIDESTFGALSNVVQAIEDPQRHGERYASALISSFVPFASASYQFERYTDNSVRQANGIIESIKQKIPGYAEDLMPRRDTWGEPVQNNNFGVEVSNDPVKQYLASAGFNVAMPPKQIMGVKLDEQQYDDFVRISGRTAKMQLDRIVHSSQWQRIPPEAKHQIFMEIIKQARNAARGQILRMNPSLIAQVVQAQKKLASNQQEGPQE